MEDGTGYFIVHSAIEIDLDDEITHSEPYINIFNHSRTDEDDKKRSQREAGEGTRLKVQKLAKQYFPCHIANEIVIVRSEVGCREQLPHTDYDPWCCTENCPWSLIVCMSDQCVLNVWPYSHIVVRDRTRPIDFPTGLKKCQVVLKRGDAIFFRGDTVHAGAAYDKENFRLHAYIDSPHVPREPDLTYIVLPNPHLRNFVARF
jgi:hypothetical protein